MKNLIIYLLSASLLGCTSTNGIKTEESNTIPKIKTENPVSSDATKAKNIIFLVGDGMGLSHITAGMYQAARKLNLERISTIGLSKTHAANSLITDSAASATAFSTGMKTYNGAIGVDMNKKPIETIVEKLQKENFKTGLVATSTIVHATPASFAAHNELRKNYEEIALDMTDSNVDVMIGGGSKYFNQREDGKDLLKELKAAGYEVNSDILKVSSNYSKKLISLPYEDAPPSLNNGRSPKYLSSASKTAIDRLDYQNENGYFLMIEGSQIDWGGHANDTDYLITEMIEFDTVIGEILDYAEKDGNTLVVITADHECGGFTINKPSTMGDITGQFTTDYHTASMVPVFAYGPGSEAFSGIYDNTKIFYKMMEALGYSQE